jgi:hemoglobin-like flavoprotein
MNERQKELVKSSFKLVAPYTHIAAALFYKRLFKFDPAFRHMFTGDMQEQSRKFGNILNEIIADLDNLESLVPVVEDLGRRHAGYGVQDEHYETVGTALIWTLRQTLGPDFTPPVEEAWQAAYDFLADVMKNAANELPLTAQTAAL